MRPIRAEGNRRGFFGAIIDRDWPGAYAILDPDSRRNLTPQEQFAARAEAYRKYLKFEPTAVRIPICEEPAGHRPH